MIVIAMRWQMRQRQKSKKVAIGVLGADFASDSTKVGPICDQGIRVRWMKRNLEDQGFGNQVLVFRIGS